MKPKEDRVYALKLKRDTWKAKHLEWIPPLYPVKGLWRHGFLGAVSLIPLAFTTPSISIEKDAVTLINNQVQHIHTYIHTPSILTCSEWMMEKYFFSMSLKINELNIRISFLPSFTNSTFALSNLEQRLGTLF